MKSPWRRARGTLGIVAFAAICTLAACADQPLSDPDLARAPEVFRASGIATWDGNRTVSGLWVAHPSARQSRRVRVINTGSGAEVDAMLYRPQQSRLAAGDNIVTVSSDLAEALGLVPGTPQRLALFGLRPKEMVSTTQRQEIETVAQAELASHVARMEDERLLGIAAALLRSMGHTTSFVGADDGALSEIFADPQPAHGDLAPVRVLVRPAGMAPMTAADLATRQAFLTEIGERGIVISIAGFADDAGGGFDPDGAPLDLIDLHELLDLWTRHYDRLAAFEKALLPLQPVWFLATE